MRKNELTSELAMTEAETEDRTEIEVATKSSVMDVKAGYAAA